MKEAYQALEPVPVTKVRARQAKRTKLDMRVKTEAARILAKRRINPEGKTLDRKKLRQNQPHCYEDLPLTGEANAAVGRKVGERSEFTGPQLDEIDRTFASIVNRAVKEVFNATN